jgi:hypothetical protein
VLDWEDRRRRGIEVMFRIGLPGISCRDGLAIEVTVCSKRKLVFPAPTYR